MTEDTIIERLLSDRSILANLPDMVAVLDRTHRIVYLNRVVPGRTVGELLGQSILGFFREPSAAVVEQALERAWATGEAQAVESHSIGGYWWESRILPIVEAGRIVRMLTTAADITERKRLEAQLRQVQKMEAVGQLTAGIAHNFNNLLGIILPTAELCRREAPPALRERLEAITHAGERGAEMVRQLLLFARSDERVHKEPVDLAACVRRTAEMCRSTFGGATTIELAIEPDLPRAMANAGQIEQVLLNVCLNARDALAEAAPARPTIALGLASGPEGCLRIRVTDNGRGMDEATSARVFEPFFTTKPVDRGTGLGLASAYAIVTEHRGSIRCESVPGQGTTFEIDLPPADLPPPAPGASPDPAA